MLAVNRTPGSTRSQRTTKTVARVTADQRAAIKIDPTAVINTIQEFLLPDPGYIGEFPKKQGLHCSC
jgi:hypothetical protein